MKQKLLRYSLALLCLILAMYCFLRSPYSVWTLETRNTDVLGFTPDGQSFWAYHSDVDSNNATIVLQRYDVSSGKVLVEHRVALEITSLELANQGQIISTHLSDDGQFASLHVPQVNQAKFKPLSLLIDLTTGIVQKLPIFGTDPGVGRYSLSPTGKWLSLHDGKSRVIQDRQTMQTMITFENEVPSDAKYCCPDQVLFSPDEKRIAVAWSHRDEKGISLSSEIRFYDPATWKEQSRLRIPEAGSCSLSSWHGDQLYIFRDTPGRITMNEYLFAIYRFNSTTSFPNNVLSQAELICQGYLRQYFNPHYVSEHRMLEKQGVDWYVIRDHRDASQGPWIDSLRNKPLFSPILNRIWPRETLALEFYQTSTQQRWNRMAIHPNSKYCISPDGQWIAGMLRYQFELNLYSTAQIIRWPGYFFVVAMLIVLIRRRPAASL